MSNAVAVIDTDAERKLAMLMGAIPDQGSGGLFPSLKINGDDEDKEGREIKKGTFYLSDQDDPIYAPSVTFRPLGMFYQWLHYDKEAKKMANRTIQIPSWKVEAKDMKGGVKCGKPSSKFLKENPDQVKKYEDITCFRLVYGLVSYEGLNADGDIVTVTDKLCVVKMKGANFRGFEDDVVKQIPKGTFFYNYTVDLSLQREKNGGVTYYVIQYERGQTFHSLDQDTMDAMQTVIAYVEADNDKVRTAYNNALKGDADADLYSEVAAYDYADLEDELKD